MKNKPETCPHCGGRLFLYNEQGKVCASCGKALNPYAPVTKRSEAPSASLTERCPTCGSNANLLREEEGKFYFSCPVCGNQFAVEPTPLDDEAPDVVEEDVEEPVAKESTKQKVLRGQEIYKIASKCTLELLEHCYEPKGATTVSSGFYITPELLLTCSHCVLDGDLDSKKGKYHLCAKIEGRYHGKAYFPLKVLYYDINHDLALIQSANRCYDPCRIAKEDARTGDKIFSVGNTKGLGMCIMQGIVSDENRILTMGVRQMPMMMNTANTQGGNSGCPTFNAQGEVVGVHTAGSMSAAAMKYDAPVHRIRAFLKDAERALKIKIDID